MISQLKDLEHLQKGNHQLFAKKLRIWFRIVSIKFGMKVAKMMVDSKKVGGKSVIIFIRVIVLSRICCGSSTQKRRKK